jgi:hypothetical protein
MKCHYVLVAVSFLIFGQAGAADYLRWVPANPAQSCMTICDKALSYDAVYNKGAHKSGAPVFVCSATDGLPGANHTYSVKAAALCHIQRGGKGSGVSQFSCLCAPKQ